MAFCHVRGVKTLHELLHGIPAASDIGSTLEPDGELLADIAKENAAANCSAVAEPGLDVATRVL